MAQRPPERAQVRSRPAVPPGLERAAAISWRLLVVVATALAVLYLLVLLRVVVLPVIVASFAAALLAPPAFWLRRRGWPPLTATWLVFGGALLLVAGVVAVFAPLVAGELGEVRSRAIEGVEEVQRWLAGPPFRLSRAELTGYLQRAQEELSANSQGIGPRVARGVVLVGELITGSLLTLVLTFFFVKDGDTITNWLLNAASPRYREDLRAIGRRAAVAVSGYLRGVAIVGLVDGFFIGLGLVLLRVPLALPLAVLTFVGAFLPLVGAFVAGTLAALVALVSKGPIAALVVVAITVAVQQIEGHVLAPLVLGRAVKLHPVVILLALGAGAVLGGIVGAFLAVPVSAVVAAVGGYLRGREPPEMTAEVEHRPARPPPAQRQEVPGTGGGR
ncbi:MAG TPA: AI-2E family transporter [Actinomycetes bacterium]|nr:AI-2E family transporter [Actinomycetes bacterium]